MTSNLFSLHISNIDDMNNIWAPPEPIPIPKLTPKYRLPRSTLAGEVEPTKESGGISKAKVIGQGFSQKINVSSLDHDLFAKFAKKHCSTEEIQSNRRNHYEHGHLSFPNYSFPTPASGIFPTKPLSSSSISHFGHDISLQPPKFENLPNWAQGQSSKQSGFPHSRHSNMDLGFQNTRLNSVFYPPPIPGNYFGISRSHQPTHRFPGVHPLPPILANFFSKETGAQPLSRVSRVPPGFHCQNLASSGLGFYAPEPPAPLTQEVSSSWPKQAEYSPGIDINQQSTPKRGREQEVLPQRLHFSLDDLSLKPIFGQTSEVYEDPRGCDKGHEANSDFPASPQAIDPETFYSYFDDANVDKSQEQQESQTTGKLHWDWEKNDTKGNSDSYEKELKLPESPMLEEFSWEASPEYNLTPEEVCRKEYRRRIKLDARENPLTQEQVVHLPYIHWLIKFLKAGGIPMNSEANKNLNIVMEDLEGKARLVL